MAFSHCNFSTSTLVPSLGTPFNTILYFSDHLAYLPNAPWYSRWIHQRGHLSPRSPSSTSQPGQIALPVPRQSIVLADNDPNWEDTPATNSITNLTANRPTSSTCLWSKPCQSNNTNEQLAEVSWVKYSADLLTHLMLIRLPVLILIHRELKPASPTPSVTLSLTSLIISCSNVTYILTLIWHNLTWTLQK